VVDVPVAVVTVTSTVPVPGGLCALISPSELTEKEAAGTPPKLTPVASVKPAPLMVTEVPPASSPTLGAIPLTAGNTRWSPREVADSVFVIR